MNILKELSIKMEESTNLFYENIRLSRCKWVDDCGGRKYMRIENNKIILHVGDKCKHSFTFDDIQSAGYSSRDNENNFIVIMSKDSSTNKGDKTETYYYNVHVFQNIRYECDDIFTLVKQLEKNHIRIRNLPNRETLSNISKDKRILFYPIFLGSHLVDKQDELDEKKDR